MRLLLLTSLFGLAHCSALGRVSGWVVGDNVAAIPPSVWQHFTHLHVSGPNILPNGTAQCTPNLLFQKLQKITQTYNIARGGR